MGCLKLHIDTEPTLSVAYQKKGQKVSKITGSCYPFGLKHKGYNNVIAGGNDLAQNYGYNGVELNESLSYNMNEMVFRHYDPTLGRFNVIDMAAELEYDITPYRFGFNNPVYWNDPTGLWERTEKGGYKTNDQDEIARLVGYLNRDGSDGSFEGISNFIQEDIAFTESMNDALQLSQATITFSKSTGKSSMTAGSQLKLRNEIAYYQGTTNYLYNKEDFQMRNKILQGGRDPISTELLRRESAGQFLPVTASNYIDYIGNETSARMLNFASFMESVDSPAMELGAVTRVKSRLGSISTSRFRHSASSKVSRFLGLGSGADVPANVRNMSFKEYHSKFSSHYKGKFKGRGTYMMHMSMDWKALQKGL